ncbi:meiotic recombination protein Ski8/Rec14 [Cordyceps javanica]|uniref:Meiotic recombination protein Ski8/Rec14 n=1 Tax=Cordyceps javanica TaxID=43265 RepID=A0A545V006_9HYPO|nr:meiotic recombination protein Ski8/Rec14 [Cordyceps javanica]
MAALFPRIASPAVFPIPRLPSLAGIAGRLLPTLGLALPGISIAIPTLLDDIWEGILRAVPKNKVSHSRKRMRQLANKGLKDVNSLCQCPGCGAPKRMHRLCQNCLEETPPTSVIRSLQLFTCVYLQSHSHGTFTMSKQYLTTHTVDNAHITDIFALASTPKALLSAGGSSTIHVHDTTDPAFPLKQSIPNAHKLGCHHLCTSRNGRYAASAGFGGEVKIWALNVDTGEWSHTGEITGSSVQAGEVWALALSEDGGYLASTTNDGRINVWDVADEVKPKIREYETGSAGSGSFGMCVDLSRDGKFTASGHQNGAVYIFDNDTGRILYSLSGLAKPVRAVAFSPGNTRLAAAGDAGIIALYDMKHGEHIGNLTGHSSWITTIDWSDTGEYLLSGSMDGKVKVWSVERSDCVATHSETDKALWAVRWLPKTGRSEMFCTAGANRSLSFYREATGG